MKKDYLKELVKEVIHDHIWRHLDEMFYIKPLGIQGVEVTQSIQYYRSAEHLTDAADRGPDNSLRLVANKTTWVRVYVRAHPDPVPDVTGTLYLDRQIFVGIWSNVSTITAVSPGSVTAEVDPSYSLERGDINATLNFIIPAEDMWGQMRLRVEVTGGTHSDDKTIDIDATLKQTMRLAGIMVGYDGPNAAGTANINLPAPGLTDLQNTTPWTLTVYPISEATFRVVSTITLDEPLTDAALCDGCCSANWNELLADLTAEKVADGAIPGDLYYGLLTNGIPMGPIFGCASTVVGSGGNGAEVTMAHEIGHQLGFGHSPCDTAGDAGYPAYEPYDPAGNPTASIGEYGLDINNGDIKSPANHKCYMSYCWPRWMSIYRYSSLILHADLNPEYVGVPMIWWREWLRRERIDFLDPDPPPFKLRINPMDVITIIGVMHRLSVKVKSVMRVNTYADTTKLIRLPMTAELLDGRGRILATAPVFKLPQKAMACECSGCSEQDKSDTFTFQAFVPNVAPGAQMRLICDKEKKEMWNLKAPEKAPRITSLKAEVLKDNRLRVSCSVEQSVKVSEVWVRWSDDDGKNWHPIQTRIPLKGVSKREEVLDLPLTSVPAGQVLVHIVVNDGFFTTISEPVAIEAPKQPSAVTMMHPQQNQLIMERRPLRLWAMVTDNAGRQVKAHKCCWIIDGREVATGNDTWVTSPAAGKHTCLLVAYIEDEKIERQVEFETAIPGLQDQNLTHR